MHDPCSTAFFRPSGGERRCPSCRRPWNGTERVGEGAAPKLRHRGGAGPRPRPSPASTAGRQRGRHAGEDASSQSGYQEEE